MRRNDEIKGGKKKLSIKREAVRVLSSEESQGVAGGISVICPLTIGPVCTKSAVRCGPILF